MNTIQTSKLVGFLQGAGYPLVMAFLTYVINNLGASEVFSASTSLVICGILSVVENAIKDNTGKSLFGLAN